MQLSRATEGPGVGPQAGEEKENADVGRYKYVSVLRGQAQWQGVAGEGEVDQVVNSIECR